MHTPTREEYEAARKELPELSQDAFYQGAIISNAIDCAHEDGALTALEQTARELLVLALTRVFPPSDDEKTTPVVAAMGRGERLRAVFSRICNVTPTDSAVLYAAVRMFYEETTSPGPVDLGPVDLAIDIGDTFGMTPGERDELAARVTRSGQAR